MKQALLNQMVATSNFEAPDVVTRFIAHAAVRPEAAAVKLGDAAWTYAELDRASSSLARRLQEAGIGSESFVALLLPRSFDLVAAILAVLKSGGAYVPIDPEYPEERVNLILEDYGAKHLITGGEVPSAAVSSGVLVIRVDDLESRQSELEEAPLFQTPDPDSAAYMIYTSGSTGKPKGVIVTRRNLNRLFTATEGLFDFGPQDVWTLFHSYAFDFSVWELWGALAYGGCLVIVPSQVARSALDFHALLRRHGVTVLNQTPSAFYNLQLAELKAGTGELKALRFVIFGGEALDPRRLVPWFERYGECRPKLINMYGITETTVHATYRLLSAADGQQSVSPIGRPLPDLDILLVNSGGSIAGDGEAGEIWIAGAGVARGYHNRPVMTRERFTADPTQPNRWVYRSGDLARRRADGELEYLGRIDDQVKIGGYRIELGEIEAALRRHPGVADAVAAVRAGSGASGGERQLIGYLIPGPAGLPAFEELRSFLQRQLPSYMVCHRFVVIDQLPLSPHGKLDRNALPDPGCERPGLAAEYVEPRTDLERTLCEAVSTAVGLSPVGIYDDFFMLGGTSLAATRMCTRLGGSLPISTADVFTLRTPSALASVLGGRQAGDASSQSFLLSKIMPQPRGKDLPLTHAQERIWLIQKLAPASAAYTFDASIRFNGNFDPEALRGALALLLERHEVLRTTFPQTGNGPVQRIHTRGILQLEEFSIEHLSGAEAEQEIERRRRAAIQQPFDLERLPLIRWHLFKLSNREHVLLHREHHLLHDGWSFFVLLEDLLELYTAAAAGRPSQLPPLTVQIADFAAAQRAWVASGLFDRQLAFWRERLMGSPALLPLPTDYSRPAEPSYRGDSVRFRLDEALVRLAKQCGRAEGVTFSMTMLAAFAAQLGRLSGAGDICIGSGMANRRTPESGSIVGMVINNVVLRFNLRICRTFRELLAQVREVVGAALDNQDVPFDVVASSISTQRSGAHPLCQVFFTTYDGPVPQPDIPDLTVATEVGLPTFSAKFDLNVMLISQGCAIQDAESLSCGRDGQVTMIWEFSTDLFERQTIKRLTAQYLRVLKQGLEHPDVPLENLDWLSPEELRWLRGEARGPEVEHPRGVSLTELFQRQVARRPEAIAVVCGVERLTYTELDQRARAIAARLKEHLRGEYVRSGEPMVGVLLERGAAAVSAMLGVLQAGAAYLPLSPHDPPARLARLIEQAGAGVVLTVRNCADRLPRKKLEQGSAPSVRAILLDECPASVTEVQSSAAEPAGEAPLACLLFTSGSTGVPKGVEVLQRGIVRLLFGQDYAHFGPEERILQLAPLTFDAATFEIWGALLHGGSVVIHPEDVPDLENLGRTIRENGISMLWLNSALFNTVIDENPKILSSVRQLLIGGEALSVPHVRKALALLPGLRIVNGYGPTENTTFSCCYPIPRELVPNLISVPIGKPLANSSAYVLDRHLRPVPVGVTGEIYLGGDGLARGYRCSGGSAAAAEAGRFLPDPFSGVSGARLYRTGDLGAVLPDGTIQFRGRRDNQVKIRGFRIEPGEVEAVLTNGPGVSSGAVVAQGEPGRRRLVAYIVPLDGAVDLGLLRTYLGERLPGYMVPERIAVLERLPLTAHGKVDRAALSALEAEGGEDAGRSVVEPRNGSEADVLQVFREILGRSDIGVHDDFFRAGGHSLLAIRLAARISERLSVKVGLRELFDAPTPAALSASLSSGQKAGKRWRHLLAVRTAGPERPLFFAAGGDGGVVDMAFYGRLAEYVPNRPFYGLLSTSMEDGEHLLEPTAERLSAAFVREIREIQPEGPYDLAGGCIGGILAFEIARQLAAEGQQIGRVILLDTCCPNAYACLRQSVREACVRTRYYLRKFLTRRDGRFGYCQQKAYRIISDRLPFSVRDASPDTRPTCLQFVATVLRYRPKPFQGALHLIVSQEFAAKSPQTAWGKWAKGGVTVEVAPGDHWTYVRDHFSSAAEIFRRAATRH